MPTMSSYFYPRPPQGGRQPVNVLAEQGVQFLSTPSARRATVFGVRLMILMVISIHALRKEGDSSLELAKQMTENFYPRPPQGGRPGQAPASVCGRMISIHALRKEGDTATAPRTRRSWYFYPRPPQGGRRGKAGNQYRHHAISIHALRKEGDASSNSRPVEGEKFLSTPSARRATSTASCCALPSRPFLSTPSARRATAQAAKDAKHPQHFYPRPPQGGRLLRRGLLVGQRVFLSTPSARRATLYSA